MSVSLQARPPHSDPAERPAPVAGRARPRGVALAAVVHVVSLVGGYAALLLLMRGTWFRGDDFEFLANRVGPSPRMSLWLPHNEHWSTGPILVWRAIYSVAGMTSVVPYLAASLAVHVLAAHLLWRLMRRLQVGPWTSTALAAVFVFLGAGAENITWAFQLGFMGSVALGLLALLLLDRGGAFAVSAAVLVSIVSLTFSGMSVVLVGMGVVYLLVVRRWPAAVAFAVPTGAVYLAWYALAGHLGARPQHTHTFSDRLADAAPWAWSALTSAAETFVSAPGAGWLLLGGLVFGVVRTLRARAVRDDGLPLPVQGLVATLVVGVVAEVGSLAVQRGDISLPDTGRYAYVLLAFLLPLLGLALSDLRLRVVRILAGAFLAYLLVTQAVVLVAAERPAEDPELHSDVLGLAVLLQDGDKVFPTELAVDVNVRSVRTWADRGDLGSLGAVPAQAVSDARAQAEVRVAPAAPDGAVHGGLQTDGSGPCTSTATTPGDLAATLQLTPDTTVSVMAPDGGHLAYQVTDAGPASRLITVPLEPHRTYWFSVTESRSLAVVASEGQPLQFCGA